MMAVMGGAVVWLGLATQPTALCQQKAIDRGYVVTKSLDDFGTIADLPDTTTRILRIPAPLLCYWMGESELTPEQQ